MKRIITYQQTSKISLIILWTGGILLCFAMLYAWHQQDRNSSKKYTNFVQNTDIHVYELLLTYKDFQLDENVNLININLNADPSAIVPENINDSTTPASTTNTRKLIYSKILEQKIKKISSRETDSPGFTIKPLPQ